MYVTMSLHQTGNYMGDVKDFNVGVMHAYVDMMDFTGMGADVALRFFLSGFRLPGEVSELLQT